MHTPEVTIQIQWLVGLSPKWSIPRISEPISLPLSSSLLKSQQLYLTCNINNLIYFLAPSFSPSLPNTDTQLHRRFCLLPFSYLCLQEMWATQHSIKTIFCTIDPTAFVSPACVFFFFPPPSPPGPPLRKLCFLEVLLFNDEVNGRRWLCFIKSSRWKTVTIHTEMKWITGGETHTAQTLVTHTGYVAYHVHTDAHICVRACRYEGIRAHLFVPAFPCRSCWHCLHWAEKPCRLSGCHFELPPPRCHRSI